MNNVKVPREDMDQIHLPDPVMNDIETLKKECAELKEALKRLM